METQKQDTSLSIGTFQNTKEVIIHGGSFAVNYHNTIDRESNTDSINIKKLYEHISTAALHNSRERAQEVPETELKKIVHEWSPRLRTLQTTISTPPGSPLPLSSPFDRLSTDDALSDIFKWLYDPFTPYSVLWMHGNTRTQALRLASALAHILHQHRLLSASYFFSTSTDSASIIPTIAYQLAQNITQAAVPIARAVGQNLAVFTSRCHDQVEQLIINPLRNASDLSRDEFFEAPKVIVIHGLEDYNDKDNFQTSFLDSLTRAVRSLDVTYFPQKVLVLGHYTDRLQECFSNLASELKIVVQRPIQLHNLLEKEHEICRKEKEIEKWVKALANKENSINAGGEALRRKLRSQEAHLNEMEEKVKQRSKELEKREGALRRCEEEICQKEKEIEKRDKALANKEKSINARTEDLHMELRSQDAYLNQQKKKELEKRAGALRCREEEICRKEKEIERRDEALMNKEKSTNARAEGPYRGPRSQDAHLNQQRKKEPEKREGALRYEEIISQEEEMEDTTRRRKEALGLREEALAKRKGDVSVPQMQPMACPQLPYSHYQPKPQSLLDRFLGGGSKKKPPRRKRSSSF